LVEWWRERRELRRRHLMDIKERCLKPLLEELHDLRRSFGVGERTRLSSLEVRRSLESDVGRWWELFSFRGRVDSLLYEDLRNHFPELYKELEGLESWVRAKYPEFLRATLRLLELIKGDSEFKAFEERFRKGFVNEVSSYPTRCHRLLSVRPRQVLLAERILIHQASARRGHTSGSQVLRERRGAGCEGTDGRGHGEGR